MKEHLLKEMSKMSVFTYQEIKYVYDIVESFDETIRIIESASISGVSPSMLVNAMKRSLTAFEVSESMKELGLNAAKAAKQFTDAVKENYPLGYKRINKQQNRFKDYKPIKY